MESACKEFRLRRVVVVDNNSFDGSQDIRDLSCGGLEVIQNVENVGFATACNLGAEQSQADLILFLNPDTLLGPKTLDACVDFLSDPEHARVGILGVQLVDSDGRVTRTCARFPTRLSLLAVSVGIGNRIRLPSLSYSMSEWTHDTSRRVDHVIGAFYMVRRSVFQSLGGFDERFFVYLEDLDFSFRAARAGWHSYFFSEVSIFHKGGGTSSQVLGKRLFYSIRSRFIYANKHFGTVFASILLAMSFTSEFIMRLAFATIRGSIRDLLATMEGYCLLFAWAARWPRCF